MTFKNLFQLLLSKVSSGFELRMCSSQDPCPRPLSYDDMIQEEAISQNICDVGS